jgi:hypothetical protein
MALGTAHLKRLESMLGKPVPEEYVRLLAAFPVRLAEALGRRGKDAEQPLFRSPRTLIAENRAAREEDIWTEAGPWPKDHLMIGADLSGDKFTLRVSAKPAVYRLLHESGTLERIGTLSSYVKTVERELAGKAKKRPAAKEPPWVIERRKMAAKAPSQERKAKRTNEPTDWGDATLFYEAGGLFDDALRCCERWIALSGRDRFPRSVRARLLQAKRAAR